MAKSKKKKKNSGRKKISKGKANDLATSCHRVCALCWALERDGRAKEGQIAHIDRDNANDDPSNLCWLCLFHHNRYDTMMNQSKNFDKGELLKYRKDVEELVAQTKLPTSDNGSLTALLSVEIEHAVLYGLRTREVAGLELRVICSNQGTQATGIKAASLSETSILRGSLLLREKPSTQWSYPDAEVFYLGSSQIVYPGRATRWAIRFERLEGKDDIMSVLREESSHRNWYHPELPTPIALEIEPVIGAAVLATYGKVAATQMNLEEANREEFDCNRAEEQTLEAWQRERARYDEIERALRWPFPNVKQCLVPSILYRS